MNDLAIIKEIEKQIGIVLNHLSIDDLTKDFNEPLSGYSLDEEKNVIGLRISYVGFKNCYLIYFYEIIDIELYC